MNMDDTDQILPNPATTGAQATSSSRPSSLDNPHVDKIINSGTTASNCQPRHTREEDELAAAIAAEIEAEIGDLDLLDSESNDNNQNGLTAISSADENSSVVSSSSRAQKRKSEKKAMKEQARLKKIEEKKAAAAAAAKEKEEMDPRKMGYIQMARMGYQELVNAIIRPPRAEYKVSSFQGCFWKALML